MLREDTGCGSARRPPWPRLAAAPPLWVGRRGRLVGSLPRANFPAQWRPVVRACWPGLCMYCTPCLASLTRHTRSEGLPLRGESETTHPRPPQVFPSWLPYPSPPPSQCHFPRVGWWPPPLPPCCGCRFRAPPCSGTDDPIGRGIIQAGARTAGPLPPPGHCPSPVPGGAGGGGEGEGASAAATDRNRL